MTYGAKMARDRSRQVVSRQLARERRLKQKLAELGELVRFAQHHLDPEDPQHSEFMTRARRALGPRYADSGGDRLGPKPT